MNSQAGQITIAITVYDRREFVVQAVESALNQTIPVKVIVVEDCGPDQALQSFVSSRFGSKIKYIRNPKRLGLFGNWNACLESCDTPWLSILHDDDYFKETFVETMLKLRQAAPGRGLYFGSPIVVDTAEQLLPYTPPVVSGFWQEIDLCALANSNFLGFAGHLFPVEYIRKLGGFRSNSRYSGDWDMWFRLVSHYGGAHTGTQVVAVRSYEDWRKGTTKVKRTGENHVATMMQRKRNYAWLKRAGRIQRFDAKALRSQSGISAKYLIWYGAGFSRRMLDYNVRLFLISPPLSSRQILFQQVVRIFGSGFVKFCSRLWRFWARQQ